jgi:hypothetical protein
VTGSPWPKVSNYVVALFSFIRSVAIRLCERRLLLTAIELTALDHFLLGLPYRARRDQREEQNGKNHEVQFHLISPFMRRHRNGRYMATFPRAARSLGRWLSGCCAIAEATVAQPAKKKPRQCRGFLSIAFSVAACSAGEP